MIMRAAMACLTTVSYTHLDVYKRQDLVTRRSLLARLGGKRMSHFLTGHNTRMGRIRQPFDIVIPPLLITDQQDEESQ